MRNSRSELSSAHPRGRIEVSYHLIADLALNSRNPRPHSSRQIRQIAPQRGWSHMVRNRENRIESMRG